jgi:hypothetical protein
MTFVVVVRLFVWSPAMPSQTLEQRITSSVARGHLVFNRDPEEVRLSCAYCTQNLLIDYFQLGITAMNRELASFVARHKQCKLEQGMRRLVGCIMHSDDEKCEVCR